MNNRRSKQEKPLIFSKSQSGLLLRETKFNLKVLISENEDLRIEIQMMKESLKAYKTHLGEIGETRRDGKASSSMKTKSLLGEDNHELTYNATRIEQYLTSLNNQLIVFHRHFDNRNNADSDYEKVMERLFCLRNTYEQKEAQIMILQSLLINIIEKKQEINMEYYDIENKLVISFLDNSISGLRSDMAKMTKNLNLEKLKGEKAMRKREDLKNEICDLKTFKPLKSCHSSIPLENTTLKTIDAKNTTISTHQDNISERNYEKLLKKKSNKREEKIKILNSLQDEINKNLQMIDSINAEIENYDNENEELQSTINNLSSLLARQMHMVYPYEMYLHKILRKKPN